MKQRMPSVQGSAVQSTHTHIASHGSDCEGSQLYRLRGVAFVCYVACYQADCMPIACPLHAAHKRYSHVFKVGGLAMVNNRARCSRVSGLACGIVRERGAAGRTAAARGATAAAGRDRIMPGSGGGALIPCIKSLGKTLSPRCA